MTVLRRLVAAVLVAACAALLTGLLASVVPGDPVAAALGEDAPEEARAALSNELGGWKALTGLFTGELRSIRTKEPVVAVIAARLPWTLGLGCCSVFVGCCCGVFFGVLATRRRSSILPLFIAALSATPRFVLAPFLVVLFALELRWLPAGGVDDGAFSFCLPVLALALPFSGVVARHVRGALVEALASPFARSARARGVDEDTVLLRHALPHAALPVIHVTALHAGALAGGAVVVEKVFSWPGLGMLLQESLRKADLPVVEGVVVVAAFFIALSGFLADAAARLIDKRLA